MYIIDGICYAGEADKNIEVTGVKTLDDMMMLITFSNGETRLFDATKLEGPAFEPLKDTEVFRTAGVDHGVITWQDGEIDCAPEYMYENSYKYETIA